MRRKRVYVAVPLTNNRDREQALIICQYLRVRNLEVTSPWVVEEDAKMGLNAQKVYNRDVAAVIASDVVVAEVSKPSLGIGMELMVALNTGTPIACLYEEKNNISLMVRGAPKVNLIPYTLNYIDKSLKKTVDWLQSLPLMSTPKRVFLNMNEE